MDNTLHTRALRTLTYWTLLVLAALAGFGAATAHAQLADLKLASVGFEYYPYAETEETSLSPGGTEVAFQSFKANLTLPIMLDGKNTILIPAIKYSLLDVIQRERAAESGESSVDALHALMLKTSLYQRFDEDWAMFASIGGGLASDLAGDLGSED